MKKFYKKNCRVICSLAAVVLIYVVCIFVFGNKNTTIVNKPYSNLLTKKIRLLTPLECERINGFPDNWTNTGMTDKRRNFMMGNALVVGVIERIGREIENIIEKED